MGIDTLYIPSINISNQLLFRHILIFKTDMGGSVRGVYRTCFYRMFNHF